MLQRMVRGLVFLLGLHLVGLVIMRACSPRLRVILSMVICLRLLILAGNLREPVLIILLLLQSLAVRLEDSLQLIIVMGV